MNTAFLLELLQMLSQHSWSQTNEKIREGLQMLLLKDADDPGDCGTTC